MNSTEPAAPVNASDTPLQTWWRLLMPWGGSGVLFLGTVPGLLLALVTYMGAVGDFPDFWDFNTPAQRLVGTLWGLGVAGWFVSGLGAVGFFIGALLHRLAGRRWRSAGKAFLALLLCLVCFPLGVLQGFVLVMMLAPNCFRLAS